MARRLIVNADDFGMSDDVNRGILQAHREGVVTSASLMVHWPTAAAAVEQADGLDLGLHLDFAEWAYRNSEWVVVYQRVPLDNVEALMDEIRNQLEIFRRLTGELPSHIDSHQHVHHQEPLRRLVKQMADEISVPLRGMTSRVQYCGRFYGQSGKGQACHEAISLPSLLELVRNLPAGMTELGCHPGGGADCYSTYCRERALEVEALCHPRVRETIAKENIRLCTFVDLNTHEHLPQPLQAE